MAEHLFNSLPREGEKVYEDVDPNSPGSNGRTPLLYAVLSRAVGVVKMLLGRADSTLTFLLMMAEHPYSQLPGEDMQM